VTEDDVDVLEHHRTALADAGWRVVEDNGGHLRAERGRMAFELACAAGTVAKSGRAETPRGAKPTATTMGWSAGTHGTPGRRAPQTARQSGEARSRTFCPGRSCPQRSTSLSST
jgi:hypothetical protein